MIQDPVPALLLAAQIEKDGAGEDVGAWLENLDRERWPTHLITTQPAPNRALRAIEAEACEVWDLPDLMPGGGMPEFILGFIESRGIGVVHILDSRLGFDLLPDIACLRKPPVVVARMLSPEPAKTGYETYVGRRYGNLIDAFSVADEQVKDALVSQFIPPSRIEVIAPGPDSARAHAALYGRLLEARPASSRWRADELFEGEEAAATGISGAGPEPGPLRLPRTPTPERSVGIIVPCFRHGVFIADCIESIKSQTLAPSRVVVVDDGSDDPETIAALAALDRDPAIEVLRQESNLGPSAARNRALEVLDTNYVLPIDADDKLLPDAVELMVGQLETAPENVGFVYPHVRHFGNRDDFVRMPAYNLWLLMVENYCPAPALFDRRVFDEGGVRYPEEIVVGHEDWDLILQLGGRGVYGIHAAGPTFLYRRLGFSRVNAIDYGPHQFHDLVRKRHAVLYDAATEIKVAWAPAVSILLLDGEESWQTEDLAGIESQTCADFELLASSSISPRVRVVGDADDSPAGWLQTALDEARGRWLCVLTPGAAAALANPIFVERLIVGFDSRRSTHGVAFAVPSEPGPSALSLLEEEERRQARPVGFALERHAAYKLPRLDLIGEGELLADLLLELQPTKNVEWRTAPARAKPSPGPTSERASIRLDFDPALDRSEFATRDLIAHQPPRLPEQEHRGIRRWSAEEGWTPPATKFLCRHIATDGSHRMVADHLGAPPGYILEFILGAIHRDAAPGLRRLVYADHSFALTDEQGTLGGDRHPLGYVDQQPLPLLDRLELRAMPDGGELVMVAGERDPLYAIAQPLGELGWVEPLPLNPQEIAHHLGPWRAIGLRRLDGPGGHGHRYGTGTEGTFLGNLYPRPGEGLVALRRRSDDRLVSDLAAPGRPSRNPKRIAGWVAEEGGGGVATRATRLLRHSERGQSDDVGDPLGWLRNSGAAGYFPLFSTTHPVTGDQLVTGRPEAALARGYLTDGVLGWAYVPTDRPIDLD
ncbi:MAG TPA: glycosyltransferase [Solirubrobacterales bacterium]|nr:glycosyltransferase [Solirubrobacterales bacterium]